MGQTTKTISFDDELQEKLNSAIKELKKARIEGSITQSKIIRIAVKQYLDKLDRIKKLDEGYLKIPNLKVEEL